MNREYDKMLYEEGRLYEGGSKYRKPRVIKVKYLKNRKPKVIKVKVKYRLKKLPSPYKPIKIYPVGNISQEEIRLTTDAIKRILKYIPEGERRIPIHVIRGGSEYERIIKMFKKYYNPRRKQIKIDEVFKELYEYSLRLNFPYYIVILTEQDLYMSGTNFVVGIASPFTLAVISFKRFNEIKDKELREKTKQLEVYHEIGHMFGLPNPRRGRNIVCSLGYHCSSLGCAMKQGILVPYHWIETLREREEMGREEVFCDFCIDDLKKNFEHF